MARVYFDRQRDIADRPGREKEKKALLEKEKEEREKARSRRSRQKAWRKKDGREETRREKAGRKTQAAASLRRFRRCGVKTLSISSRSFLYFLCLLNLLFFSEAASAQDKSPTYAITHAKIFTLSGPTIDDGTIVIQNAKSPMSEPPSKPPQAPR